MLLTTIPGNTAPTAYSLAVDVNAHATRVYWVNDVNALLRYVDDGANATATIIATIPGLSHYYGVALEPGGNRLYVAGGGNAYYVDDPASGTAVVPNAFASVPMADVYGGAQIRSGSMVFAIRNNAASSMVRIPKP